MRIECENCNAHYTIDDEQVGDQPIGAQCPFCSHVQVVQAADSSDADYGGGFASFRSEGSGGLELESAFDLPEDPGLSSSKAAEALGFGAVELPVAGANVSVDVAPQSGLPGLDYGRLSEDGGDDPDAYSMDGLTGNSPDQLVMQAEPEESHVEIKRCQVCQIELIDEFDRVLGLCEIHQKGEAQPKSPDVEHWYVRLQSGAVRGPIALPALQQMIRSGEVPASAQASKSGIDYQELGSFAELAVILSSGGRPSRPRAAYRRRISLRPFLIVAVFGGLGAFSYVYRTQLIRIYQGLVADFHRSGPGRLSPLRRYVADWRTSMPDISGSVEEQLEKALAFHILDTPTGYEEAEKAYKRALLLDEDNIEAMSGYVENMVIWRYPRMSEEEVGLARRVISYAIDSDPDSAAPRRAAGALGLAAGDLNGCRSGGNAALDLDPRDARARAVLAGCYMQGNVQLALKELRIAKKSLAGLRRSDRVFSQALRLGGRYKAAIEVIDKALVETPNRGSLYFELAETNFALARLDLAKEYFKKALSLGADPQLVQLRLAEMALYELNPTLALEYLQKAANAYSPMRKQGARVFALMGRSELELENFGRALEFAKQALELDPKSLEALIVAAESELSQDTFESAETFLRRAQKERDKEPAVLVVASMVANRKNQPAAALENLRTALQREPKNVAVAALLAGQQLAMDRTPQAYGTMRRAADIDPARFRPAPQPGQLFISSRAVKEAMKQFQASSQVKRNTAVALASMALMEHAAGRTAAAERFADRALAVDDANVLASLEKIFLSMEAGRTKYALRIATRLLSIEKGNAVASLLRGRIYRGAGDLEKARDDFDASRRSNPGLLSAEVELAYLDLMQESEKRKEAKTTLARAFTVSPELLYLRRILYETDSPLSN